MDRPTFTLILLKDGHAVPGHRVFLRVQHALSAGDRAIGEGIADDYLIED